MRWTLPLIVTVVVVVTIASPAAAQIQSRPTDPPLVTAVNESWYVLREPLQLAGDLYVPTGPVVFFNGNTMVRSGHYNGIPLYTDTTVDPFSVVFVPISRGLMQPYLRLVSTSPTVLMAPVAATSLPLAPGAISVYTPATPTLADADSRPTDTTGRPAAVVATAASAAPPATGIAFVSLLPPESNDGVWIRFAGEKWTTAGAAIPRTSGDFIQAGEYDGFPVFTRRDLSEKLIYLPSRAGLLAPYRVKE